VQEVLLDLCFFNETVNFERYVQVILWQFFPQLTEKERLWLVSARLSYFSHCMYIYAGHVSYLRGQLSTRSPDLILVIVSSAVV
jgi:hypothetical protein